MRSLERLPTAFLAIGQRRDMRRGAEHDHARVMQQLDRVHRTYPLQPEVSWQVRAVLTYIDEHLFEPTLHVCTIKTCCRIRDNNISCRFKHEIGCSVMEYVEAHRLAAAETLLRLGTLSVAEVAHLTGYANLQTFYRAFARSYRCTPATLKRCSEGQQAPPERL